MRKKFNVTIVEQNKTKAFEIADQLPDAMVIHGDGRSVELLEEEDIDSMDAFISVTENSETNIMSCLMAKSKSQESDCFGRKHGLFPTITFNRNRYFNQ